ncbi:uncharacterized protein LTR77_001256 [Saxophila tyrrhenica]|uniref:HORMA domain-containing protein n=1 Tax=Saxophila tyrrhenica TaxID=1690608 RepID=A0AAV9PN13_9PEZI|nr:hypothetical protein LTR77_001256 [Saxophila tyrrhenica]
MATIQISKTKGTETLNKTEVTQKQSIDVVQTMLHSGLSCITYLRNLLADKAYDMQEYDSTATIQPYDEYASGRAALTRRRSTQRSAKLQVLRRGRSKRVDLLLDWLRQEHGAFPALQAGNLRSMEIHVHTDPEHPERVVETYTFKIRYAPRPKGGQLLAGVQLEGPGGSSASVGATNEALKGLLRQLIAHCADLPDLPSKRYMSMALFYERDTAVADKPTGFVPNDTMDLTFAATDGWEKKERYFENLGSGFHRTSMGITYLQPLGYAVGAGLKPPKIPDWITYRTEPGLDSLQSTAPTSAVAEQRQLTATPSTVVESEYLARTSTPEDSPTALSRPSTSPARKQSADVEAEDEYTGGYTAVALLVPTQPLLSQFGGTQNTQSSNVPEMKRNLRSMMHAEHFTQGDTQTQAIPSSQPSGHNDTAAIPASSPRSSPAQATLSGPVIDASERSKCISRQKTRSSAKAGDVNEADKDHTVLCQCEHHETEGDMVQCTYCSTWQHLHCYGYKGQDDERLPEVHVCYDCLLSDDDTSTRSRLQELTMKRRAMYHALSSGLSTPNQLAGALGTSTIRLTGSDFANELFAGIPNSAAKDLFAFLKSNGYFIAAKQPNTRRHTGSRRLSSVALKEGPKYQEMLASLFDPLLHISHYYGVVKASSMQTNEVQQRLVAKAGGMPPPVTPASQLRKRKAAQTPASGLDLRQSMTPYDTPPHLRTHLTRSSKRARLSGDEDEVVAATPPKARRRTTSSPARVKSVRTAVMLDAAGLPSSPGPSSYENALMA